MIYVAATAIRSTDTDTRTHKKKKKKKEGEKERGGMEEETEEYGTISRKKTNTGR